MTIQVITTEPLRSWEEDLLLETMSLKKVSQEQKMLLVHNLGTTWFGISLPYNNYQLSELESTTAEMIFEIFERCNIPFLHGYRIIDIREVDGAWFANPFHLQGYALMLSAHTWPN